MKPRLVGRILILSFLMMIVIYFLALALPNFLSPYRFTPSLEALKGGRPLGFKLGYAGVLMLLIAQTYSFKLFGSRDASKRLEWLNLHCYLTVLGGSLILVHSGFPFSFTYANPFAHIYQGFGVEGLVGVQGFAAWLVLILVGSGFFGRYLYRRLPAKWAVEFKYWLFIHVALTGALYVTGVIHLLIAVGLQHVSAV